MALSDNSITLFAEGDLSQYLGSLIGKMEEEIKSEDSNKLLNVNESQYIEYLAQRYSVEVPVIYPDRLEVSQSERMIPAEYPLPRLLRRAWKELSPAGPSRSICLSAATGSFSGCARPHGRA